MKYTKLICNRSMSELIENAFKLPSRKFCRLEELSSLFIPNVKEIDGCLICQNNEEKNNIVFSQQKNYKNKFEFEFSENEVFLDYYLKKKYSLFDKVKIAIFALNNWIIFFSNVYPQKKIALYVNVDEKYDTITWWVYTIRNETDNPMNFYNYDSSKPLAYYIINNKSDLEK